MVRQPRSAFGARSSSGAGVSVPEFCGVAEFMGALSGVAVFGIVGSVAAAFDGVGLSIGFTWSELGVVVCD
ncbi:MAG: hypothetical protein ABI702_08930 [Burkholderiales bacterium]